MKTTQKKMTFKDFINSIFRLPARIFNGLTTLVLGGYAIKKDHSLNKEKPFLGLLGLILEGAKKVLDFGKWIGRSMTAFLKDHEKAIASAFWMSLLIGGAAALTVAFWPAALAFVANFTIAGYSIASVVGAGYAAQVAATAAVATVLTSAAVYTVAAVSNFVSFVKSCFTKSTTSANEADFSASNLDASSSDVPVVSKSLSAMNPKATKTPHVTLEAPVHTAAVLKAATPEAAVVEELASTATMTAKI